MSSSIFAAVAFSSTFASEEAKVQKTNVSDESFISIGKDEYKPKVRKCVTNFLIEKECEWKFVVGEDR